MNRCFALPLGVAAVGLLVFAPVSRSVEACSRILFNTSRPGVYSARSVDWNELIAPGLRVYPRGLRVTGGLEENAATWSSKYGSAVIVGLNYGGVALDGINERGLAAHLLYLDDADYGPRDGRPGVSYLNWLRYMLDNFATVEEAVTGMKKIQVAPVPIRGRLYGIHVAIEDATGDSAIFEHLNGELVVHHGRQFSVMANAPSLEEQLRNARQYQGLGGDKELPGGIESPDRFVRASYYLKHLPEPKDDAQGVAFVLQLIRNVSVPFGAPYKAGPGAGVYPTWWVTAMDLRHRVYFFSATESPNTIWLDLNNLDLSPGQPIRKLDLANPALVGEISRALEAVPSPRSTTASF